MSTFDRFYPYSDTVALIGKGIAFTALIQMRVKLNSHLIKAKNGSREYESRLINRLGQLRRCCPHMPQELKEEIQDSVNFLRSVGRNIDFKNSDPRFWVSARGGGPRW